MSGTNLTQLSGIAAMIVAQTEPLHKLKGEKDTEFVKRIVRAYQQAEQDRLAASSAPLKEQAEANMARLLWPGFS